MGLALLLPIVVIGIGLVYSVVPIKGLLVNDRNFEILNSDMIIMSQREEYVNNPIQSNSPQVQQVSSKQNAGNSSKAKEESTMQMGTLQMGEGMDNLSAEDFIN